VYGKSNEDWEEESAKRMSKSLGKIRIHEGWEKMHR
jgi:hypothetical protein